MPARSLRVVAALVLALAGLALAVLLGGCRSVPTPAGAPPVPIAPAPARAASASGGPDFEPDQIVAAQFLGVSPEAVSLDRVEPSAAGTLFAKRSERRWSFSGVDPANGKPGKASLQVDVDMYYVSFANWADDLGHWGPAARPRPRAPRRPLLPRLPRRDPDPQRLSSEATAMNRRAALLCLLCVGVVLAFLPSCKPQPNAEDGDQTAPSATTDTAPQTPAAQTAPAEPAAGADDTHGLVLSVSVAGREFGPNDPVPVAYSVRNTGTEHVFVRADPSLRPLDASGHPPPGTEPVATPPPSPPSHYMEIGGKSVYVMEVYELAPNGAHEDKVADAFAHCHPVPAGTYTMNPKVRVWVHRPETVIRREDMAHKTWVDPEKVAYEVTLTAPPISIEVKGG